jgi:histidinol-phosphate aminotransferase
LLKVPYHNDHEDPDALIDLARKSAPKLIYIANPDNPMGSHHPAARIERMVEQVPSGSLLILDEAYIDLAPPDTAPEVSPDDPRVIRMRTFSKGYGLAGARVGYAIAAPELILAFNKIRNHFGMCRISQAGALAALADQEHLRSVCARVGAAREALSAIARQNGLVPLPSATNFVAMDCGAQGGFARRVLTELVNRDIFVRMPFVAPQDRCIRVSTGPEAAMAAFSAALPLALAAARAASPA